ncbi:hypothetical protein Tco_0876002 [Tanacetum coccineum]|uniref:Reverse transcriptase domain-containing protein n=1 Tax=Tanacetum coccineum TaxID=301880 RepID=A0ABQ5BTW6_9ASTR
MSKTFCFCTLRYLSENEIESPWISSQNFQGQSSEYNVNWVMVDRLTKSAHFLAIREDYSTEKIGKRIYIDKVDPAHGSSCADYFRFRWMIYLVVLADAAESVSDAIRFEYCLASLSMPNIRCAPFEALYVLVKEKPKATGDHQKSYADNRRKSLEFEVGDRVMLKVSPWKGEYSLAKGSVSTEDDRPMRFLERIQSCSLSVEIS